MIVSKSATNANTLNVQFDVGDSIPATDVEGFSDFVRQQVMANHPEYLTKDVLLYDLEYQMPNAIVDRYISGTESAPGEMSTSRAEFGGLLKRRRIFRMAAAFLIGGTFATRQLTALAACSPAIQTCRFQTICSYRCFCRHTCGPYQVVSPVTCASGWRRLVTETVWARQGGSGQCAPCGGGQYWQCG